MSIAEQIAEEVRGYLDLSHRPVGIQIGEGPRQAEPSMALLRFCILEREDLSSGSRTFVFGDIECPGASLALGMVEPVHVDVEPRIHVGVTSVRVGPVEGADQVVFTVTPRQAMVLAVLTGGIEAHCTGTHAVCGEVIARVYETGRPHLSLLCQGMRDLCGFRDEELVVGISWNDFVALPHAMARHASLRANTTAIE
ncbi:MAG: DUF169 domain-containing protein [Anaerolineae bacterium]